MKLRSPTVAGMVFSVIAAWSSVAGNSSAQLQGYNSQDFAEGGVQQAGPYEAPLPASPLAGGMPAAAGGEFVDAAGNPIILPAQYMEGYGPAPMAGYGDPMAIDFGGYGQDQNGPHYFDVAFETVFLKQEELAAAGLPVFASEGVRPAMGPLTNPHLDVSNAGDDYEAGWRIAGRYDLGALSVFEATYTGLYDLGFTASVNSSQIGSMMTNQLFSVFSDYGFFDQAGGGAGVTGLDEAQQYNISYQSELQSTELSYRRYWVANNPRISGTYLAGFRYTRLTEEFLFLATTPFGDGQLGTFTENDLVGFQFGGDGWISLRQGFRVGCTGKTGVYNNHYKFSTTETNVSGAINDIPDLRSDQISFIAEGGASFVIDLLPSWSLKGGYEFLYLNSLVTIQDNINLDLFLPTGTVPAVDLQNHQFYHGFHAGLEYIW